MPDTTTANGSEQHHSLLKQALRALEEMRQKLAAAESRLTQPIAIIGMGCRFPGGSDNPAAFWEFLKSERDAVIEVPPDRWKIDDYYDPDVTTPGKMVSRYGGFLNGVDQFDAAFFGIAPREAALMDPQQRILLEVAWHALEDAAIAPASLAGTRTGMFLGIASGDYAQLQLHAANADLLDVHYASGNAHSIAAGRISYLLGLKGPSIAVDTACSSSLVAVHLACQSLRSGESTLAIAGGVNVILSPETTIALSRAHMLAPDGRCKVFDGRADGFTRAEGCGVLVLKPLRQAEQDGDRILAVIRGSASNQDGASSSLTAPNGPSQEDLMRQALSNAGLAAGRVTYVETHGTGTALGDPIELRALGSVYGSSRNADSPLVIGSLKTNLGHMEAAAGIGGLIKLVLSLRHGEIPAHRHFQEPTTHIPWSALNLSVPRHQMPWPSILSSHGKSLSLIGAVSSFGFSGTNAHIVVEQGAVDLSAQSDSPSVDLSNNQRENQYLLPISAQTDTGLHALLADYKAWLGSAPAVASSLRDIAFTAAIGRNHLRHRISVVASDCAQALASIAQLPKESVAAPSGTVPHLCFLFTGQGSERNGMGLDLLKHSTVFRSAIERVDKALEGLLDRRIQTIWENQSVELSGAIYVQPALYAFGWALSELWRSFGVEPDTVIGHSLGEYVAATVAGVMTPEEGVRLVASRGRLTHELAKQSSMLVLVADLQTTRELINNSTRSAELSIAAINSPSSIVVSGPIDAIITLEQELVLGAIRYKRLRTTHGFHSAALDPMLDLFEAEASRIIYRIPQTDWVSNLTGRLVDRDQPVKALYWRRHLRETVQFASAVIGSDVGMRSIFIEIGAQPQLLSLFEELGIAPDRQIPSIGKSGADGEWHKLLTAAGKLFSLGVDLDWQGVYQGSDVKRVSLPNYPFQHRRFWFTDGRIDQTRMPAVEGRLAGHWVTGHPLLQEHLNTSSAVETFQSSISPSWPRHLAQHVVTGAKILPGAAYLEMAVAAAHYTAPKTEWRASQVEFQQPCSFDEARLVELNLFPAEGESRSRRFTVASIGQKEDRLAHRDGESRWTVHAEGILEVQQSVDQTGSAQNIELLQQMNGMSWDHVSFYKRFEQIGLQFGPAFRSIRNAIGNDRESLVEIQLEQSVIDESGRYVMHPIALDACLQSAAALNGCRDLSAPALPAALRSYHLLGDPQLLRYACARVQDRKGRSLTVDISGLDAQGNILLALEGLTLVAPPDPGFRGWLHEVQWRRVSLPGAGFIHVPQAIHLDSGRLQIELREAARKNQVDRFDLWMSSFHRLCAAWIADAFEGAGFTFDRGRKFTYESVLEQLSIVPAHRKLLHRFLDILAELRYFQPVADNAYIILSKPHFDTASAVISLGKEGHPEFAWTERMADRLIPLLRGKEDPLEVLFSDGGREIASRLYRGSVVSRVFSASLAVAALEAVKQCPGGAKILEVGGGTGASTSYVLPSIAGQISDYLWTDIGLNFVQAAQREFGSVPGMRFNTLNLEIDPFLQVPLNKSDLTERFDIVIASNVVHATSDVRRTLGHIRSLLRPGGLLLLAETVDKQPWIDLTVGFTEGWWSFEDHHLRPSYPLLNRQEWTALLRESGFDPNSLLPDSPAGALCGQCLFASVASATALPNRESIEPAGFPRPVLVVTDHVPILPGGLASALVETGRKLFVDPVFLTSHNVSSSACQDWYQRGGYINGSQSFTSASVRRSDIFYLPAAESPNLPLESSGTQALEWQQHALVGALRLIQALIKADLIHRCRLCMVTRGACGPKVTSPNGATLSGFVRSVRAEYPDAEILLVDLDCEGLNPAEGSNATEALDPSSRSNPTEDASRLLALAKGNVSGSGQWTWRGADCFVPSLVPVEFSSPGYPDDAQSKPLSPIETLRLHFPGTGLLDDLKPVVEHRISPMHDQVEIKVVAAALNFHEVLTALENKAEVVPPGGECSALVTRVGTGIRDLSPGDEVVAVGSGLMAEFQTLTRERIWRKPAGVDLVQAATFLIPFLTARWALRRISKLSPGESVLIHAGAGGVGLAAIQEAQNIGAVLFATAGSADKRDYLLSIGVIAVFDSRSVRFEQDVLAATNFRGVDVVLNSLGGDLIPAGLRSLAPRGRFIELGATDILDADQIRSIRPDVSYHPIHLRAALQSITLEVRETIESVLEDVTAQRLKPLPLHLFTLGEAPDAFRFMAAGRHVGRVLLAPSPVVAPARLHAAGPNHGERRIVETSPDPGFRKNGTYIVTGAFSGLGKLVVEWLVQSGAGCVLALGRNEPDIETKTQFGLLQSGQTILLAEVCDVSDEPALRIVLQKVPLACPLRGVFHAAGALADGSVPQQNAESIRSVATAKVAGSWNLHRATLSSPLDYFVLFASAAGVLGARGQSNHAAANAYLDALAHYRRDSLGLTALSIDWGAWSGIGAAVRHGVLARSERAGVLSITPAHGLRLLERLIRTNLPQVLATSVNWQRWSEHSAPEAAANQDLLAGLLGDVSIKDTLSASFPPTPAASPQNEVQARRSSWRDQILAVPAVQRIGQLEFLVESKVRAILSLPLNQELEEARPLQEYGLDSLLSIELRNALSAECAQKLPATALFDYPTVRSLTGWLFRDVLELEERETKIQEKAGPVESSLLEGVASLSDDDVERLFQQKLAGIFE